MGRSYRVRGIMLCVAVLLAVGSVSLLRGQGKSEPAEAAGSLAALTGEIRQLRLAVEESTRTQTQTQALAVYLSVQKDRILQIATRLDALRKDLDAAVAQSQEQAAQLANLEPSSAQPLSEEIRQEIAAQRRVVKERLSRSAAREQDIRTREAEILQSLQVEETRWADLISRLEQVIKR